MDQTYKKKINLKSLFRDMEVDLQKREIIFP